MNPAVRAIVPRRPRWQHLAMMLFLALAGSPVQAWACSVCFGETGSPMAKGLSMGVLFLIGVVLVVLGGVVAFFVYLAWRARSSALRSPEELGIPSFSDDGLASLEK